MRRQSDVAQQTPGLRHIEMKAALAHSDVTNDAVASCGSQSDCDHTHCYTFTLAFSLFMGCN
jgi:hypothetical protein